jgi:hypothetical protein
VSAAATAIASTRTSTRFGLVAFVPTLSALTWCGALILSGPPQAAPSVERLTERITHLGLASGLVLTTVAFIAALLLYPLQFPMVQLLEGYWGASDTATWLSAVHRYRHMQRSERLSDLGEASRDESRPEYPPDDIASWQAVSRSEETFRLVARYPDDARILPTTLGNALRAMEDRAGRPWGLPATVVYQRLYALLPSTLMNTLRDMRNQLDLSTRFCVNWLVATVVSLVVLLPYGAWLFLPLLPFFAAWAAYRGAISSAISYGEMVAVSIDLHRFDLYQALRLRLPNNYQEELDQNVLLLPILQNRWVPTESTPPTPINYDHSRSFQADLVPGQGRQQAAGTGPSRTAEGQPGTGEGRESL